MEFNFGIAQEFNVWLSVSRVWVAQPNRRTISVLLLLRDCQPAGRRFFIDSYRLGQVIVIDRFPTYVISVNCVLRVSSSRTAYNRADYTPTRRHLYWALCATARDCSGKSPRISGILVRWVWIRFIFHRDFTLLLELWRAGRGWDTFVSRDHFPNWAFFQPNWTPLKSNCELFTSNWTLF